MERLVSQARDVSLRTVVSGLTVFGKDDEALHPVCLEQMEIDLMKEQAQPGVAIRRARAYRDGLERRDRQFGLIRLVMTIGLLAGLVASYELVPAWADVLLTFGLIGVLLVFSALHRGLQRRLQFWQGLQDSLQCESDRRHRHHSKVRAALPPWSVALAKGVPPSGGGEETHLYDRDLDVRSLLLPLLDTTLTKEASSRMAQELLHAAQFPGQERAPRIRKLKVLARQSRLLRELDVHRHSVELRETALRESSAGLHEVVAQMHKETDLKRAPVYLGAFVISLMAWVLILIPAHMGFFAGGPAEEFVTRLLLYAIVPLIGLGLYRPLIELATQLRRYMKNLSILMRQIESLQSQPELADFAGRVKQSDTRLRFLNQVLDLLASRSNPVFWLFMHALVPFDSLLCILAWWKMRQLSGGMESLLNELTEFDVDTAYARFSAENREFNWSDLVSWPLSPSSVDRIEAEGMGHPLLSRAERVCNSIRWRREDKMVLLTGSNMSGKSTFLRTLGVNGILHNLGLPVCAQVFRAPPLNFLCAIRVDDALEQGTSYFYSEVKRLAEIDRVLASEQSDVLQVYLVDEIFRGTNNRERFLGSYHVIRSFIGSKGVGLVTTHDLSLAQLTNKKELQLRNMHFRESVEQARLRFDYLLRPGACPTTNALRIMHLEGLPVPAEVSLEEEENLRRELAVEIP